ncbi:MAG: hypothetical protein JXB15_16615 [Anaerolineales bacterium]|nr:hypothetical protein [Anaerolineales bacterium]
MNKPFLLRYLRPFLGLNSVTVISGLVIAAVMLASCSSAATPTPTAAAATEAATAITAPEVGQPFQLHGGEQISLPEERIWIKFEAVLVDSRCPKSVVCVQSGEARIQILAGLDKDEGSTLILSTNHPQDIANLGLYEIQLLAVEPYPFTTEQKIELKEYSITLKVVQK